MDLTHQEHTIINNEESVKRFLQKTSEQYPIILKTLDTRYWCFIRK